MMSRPHVKALVEYVRGGGTLLAEARCGWVDEKGASSPIVPGGGLDEVFGCREIDLTPLAKTGVVEIKAADEAFPLLKPGDKLDSLFFEESFDVFGRSSRVVAAFPDGRPAVVAAPFGKGRAIIAGSFLGSAYHHFKNPNNGKFFAGLADWLEIAAPVRVTSSVPDAVVEGRLLQGDGYALLFGFNRGDKAVTAKFGVRTDAAKPAAIDLETGQAVPFVRDGGRAVLEKALEPGQAWVARIMLK
jgi:beta-galactosidase